MVYPFLVNISIYIYPDISLGSNSVSRGNLCGKVPFLLEPQGLFIHTPCVEFFLFSTTRVEAFRRGLILHRKFFTFHNLCGNAKWIIKVSLGPLSEGAVVRSARLGECTIIITTLPPTSLSLGHLPLRGRQGQLCRQNHRNHNSLQHTVDVCRNVPDVVLQFFVAVF
jgi:hypothetical protein